jgi:hypothetical protein
VKISRNSLKELIRQSIDELREGGPGSGRPKGDDEPFDSGGPSYANVPKGAKTSKQAKEMSKKKKEKTEESVSRRVTVKEVKKWFKTLEENRYKKTYASDARRVSWMVNNNLSEDYESMPTSMKKKWPKAAYKRERFLAKEFVKHLMSNELTESKIRKVIRESIRDLMEGKRRQLQISIGDKNKVDKILKKARAKIGKDYDIGVGKSGSFVLDMDQKMLDRVLDIFIVNRIQVKEL